MVDGRLCDFHQPASLSRRGLRHGRLIFEAEDLNDVDRSLRCRVMSIDAHDRLCATSQVAWTSNHPTRRDWSCALVDFACARRHQRL